MTTLPVRALVSLAIIGVAATTSFAQDLTGVWKCDGRTTLVRQVGDNVYWLHSDGPFPNIFYGFRSGNTIAGMWVDMPGNPSRQTGTLSLRVETNDHFIKISESPSAGSSFGCSDWLRDASPAPVPSASLNVSGSWSGPYRNTRGESGTESLIVKEEQLGVLKGQWGGIEIVNGRRNGNIVTWEARSAGRDYRASGTISTDGKKMTLQYSVIDPARGNYTGIDEFVRQ